MSKPYSLAKNTLLNLPAQGGANVTVEYGVIWFTAAGADVVLGRGHSYQLPGEEILLIQALADCRFTLSQTRSTSRWTWLQQYLPRKPLANS